MRQPEIVNISSEVVPTMGHGITLRPTALFLATRNLLSGRSTGGLWAAPLLLTRATKGIAGRTGSVSLDRRRYVVPSPANDIVSYARSRGCCYATVAKKLKDHPDGVSLQPA
ncbi:hypothetical protein JOE65_002003 [Arthrobacter roseus]|nr:hypothetical protein [Arthrobacter roseus]